MITPSHQMAVALPTGLRIHRTFARQKSFSLSTVIAKVPRLEPGLTLPTCPLQTLPARTTPPAISTKFRGTLCTLRTICQTPVGGTGQGDSQVCDSTG